MVIVIETLQFYYKISEYQTISNGLTVTTVAKTDFLFPRQVAGLICLSLGLYLMLDDTTVSRLLAATEQQEGRHLDSQYRAPSEVFALGTAMTVAGAVMLVVAFLGCCGAAKEWRPLLVLVIWSCEWGG